MPRMPRSTPHPSAVFSMRPYNERAKGVVDDARNSHLASALTDGDLALDIGFNVRSKSATTLATLGRGDADIHISGGTIARIQCSFEMDRDTGIIMLYDRSHSQTTQVFGEFATPFEPGRPRKVVVQKNLNTIIGMGGVGQNLVMFELIWHQDPLETMQKVSDRHQSIDDYEENPCLARTVDDSETIPPTRLVTRIHTPGPQQLRIRYAKIPPQLGSGTFGVVHRAVDVDSGKPIAVKVLKRPGAANLRQWRVQLKREVEFLSQLDHPYIVPYIASQNWDEPEVEIIMELQHGNLRSLVTSGSFDDEELRRLAQLVFHHGLQALDYISSKGIVHRDIKPENFLFKKLHGEYVILLGDFGLSNRINVAQTFTGTPLYMAPEMFQNGCQQTHKVDMWAFFITIGWMLDVGGLRQLLDQAKNVAEIHREVSSAAQSPTLSTIRETAIYDPAKRASAAQMLVKCFNGEGLSTPRNKVPALVNDPPNTSTTVKALALAVPAPTPTPNVHGDVQHNGRKAAARVPPLRVGRALGLPPQTRTRARNSGIEKRPNKVTGPISRFLTPMPGKFPEEDSEP